MVATRRAVQLHLLRTALRSIVSEGDRIAILLQSDPDPDAMSSAIALWALLGRNKLTTPIFAFTPVTRPENRTTIRLLGIGGIGLPPSFAAVCRT